MHATATQVQPLDGRSVIRPAGDGAHEEKLVEHKLPVIEVAFGQGIGFFQVEGGETFQALDF